VTNLTGEQKITLAVRGVVPQRRQAMVTKKPRTSRPGLAVGRRKEPLRTRRNNPRSARWAAASRLSSA
jgi:hypothetical protein